VNGISPLFADTQVHLCRRKIMKRSFALALLATAIVGVGALSRAEAFVAAPAASGIEMPDLVQQARWVCEGDRCTWQPWNWFHSDQRSRNWAPPRDPNCFYTRRRGGWREVCPR
jgi:hypothetical protein